MGFSLTDLSDEKNILFVNYWNWRPTVELIRSFQIIDDARIECMHMPCVGAQINEVEAKQIGARIENQLLAHLPKDARVKLDLSVTTELMKD